MMSLPSVNGSLEKKIPIRMFTVALFALAGLFAAVIIYQQYAIEAGPYPISHDEAIRIALAGIDKEQN